MGELDPPEWGLSREIVAQIKTNAGSWRIIKTNKKVFAGFVG